MLVLSSLRLNEQSNFNTTLVVLNKLSNIILLSIVIPALNLIFKNKFSPLKLTNFFNLQINATNIESTVNKSVGINNDQDILATTAMQSNNKGINYINPNIQVGEPNIETIDSTIISTVGEYFSYYAPYLIIGFSGLILISNLYSALKSPANTGNVAGVEGSVNDAVASAVQAGQEDIAVAAAKAINKEMLEAMLPAEFRVFCESYKALVEAFMCYCRLELIPLRTH